MKTFAGLLAAVVATPLAIAVVFLLGGVTGLLGDSRGMIGSIIVFSLYATPMALVLAPAAGWPLARRAIRRGRTRARDFALLGAVLGALPFAGYFAWVMAIDGWRVATGGAPGGAGDLVSLWLADTPKALAWTALGATCGVASALAFWLVTVRGAPPIAQARA